MKKILFLFALFLFLHGCIKEEIVVTNYPLYDFTRHISNQSITLLLPKGMNGHYYEPTPRDIDRISNAKIFIYSGAFEPWVEKTISSLDKKPYVVKASKGIEHIKEGKKIDPHVWLSPKNAIKEAENIKEGLIEVYPENKEMYEKNFNNYIKQLKKLDEEYEQLRYCKKHYVLVSHRCLGYVAKDYGFEQIALIDNYEPTESGSIKYLNEVIDKAKKDNITVVIYENYLNPKMASIISEELNARVEQIDSMEVYTDKELNETYIDIMERNLEVLKDALQCE